MASTLGIACLPLGLLDLTNKAHLAQALGQVDAWALAAHALLSTLQHRKVHMYGEL